MALPEELDIQYVTCFLSMIVTHNKPVQMLEERVG